MSMDRKDSLLLPRERFTQALQRKPLKGRVPHFELVFFLTMEAFGKVHPSHRNYSQWFQMTEKERQLHREDMADIYIATAEKYEHSAIFLPQSRNIGGDSASYRFSKRSGNKYFLMVEGDATFSVPSGSEMVNFVYRLKDEPPG